MRSIAWITRTICASGAISLALAGTAHAERALDAVGYKAAYCAGWLREVKLEPPVDAAESAKNVLRQKANELERARTRLHKHLVSRFPKDAPPIVTAMKLGAQEKHQTDTALARCFGKFMAMSDSNLPPTFVASRVKSCADEAGLPKLKECEEARFLPF